MMKQKILNVDLKVNLDPRISFTRIFSRRKK